MVDFNVIRSVEFITGTHQLVDFCIFTTDSGELVPVPVFYQLACRVSAPSR